MTTARAAKGVRRHPPKGESAGSSLASSMLGCGITSPKQQAGVNAMLAIVSCRSQQELGRQLCSRLFARMVLGGAASSFTTAGVGANPTAAVINFRRSLKAASQVSA